MTFPQLQKADSNSYNSGKGEDAETRETTLVTLKKKKNAGPAHTQLLISSSDFEPLL